MCGEGARSHPVVYWLLVLGAVGIGMSAFTGDYAVWAYLTGSGLGGAVVAASRRRETQVPWLGGEELAEAINTAERSGFDEGVRFAVEWEENYVKGASPLTEDHVFGDYTLVMKPRRRGKKRSAHYPEQSLRAIQASGRYHHRASWPSGALPVEGSRSAYPR